MSKSLLYMILIIVVVILLYIVYVKYFKVKIMFREVIDLVVKNLEGGYYHPDMMSDGRLQYNSDMASSGETMFGLDRKNGSGLSVYPAWAKFWGLIDKADARHKWKWNYTGGTLNNPLKQLTSEIMLPWYQKLSKTYLSKEAKSIVDNDKGLMFHFAYASWNGEGWFHKFATVINKAVADGNKDPRSLENVAMNSRATASSSLITREVPKIQGIINSFA